MHIWIKLEFKSDGDISLSYKRDQTRDLVYKDNDSLQEELIVLGSQIPSKSLKF